MPTNNSERSQAVKGQLRKRHQKANFFGEALKEYRSQQRITQEEAAEKLRISQAQWSSYEKGTSRPTLDVIIAISDMFNIHPLVLIGKSLDKFRFPKQPNQQLSFVDYDKIANDVIEPYRNQRLKFKFEI